jgi:hypothetical protein
VFPGRERFLEKTPVAVQLLSIFDCSGPRGCVG